jgi:hypothetical protein
VFPSKLKSNHSHNNIEAKRQIHFSRKGQNEKYFVFLRIGFEE